MNEPLTRITLIDSLVDRLEKAILDNDYAVGQKLPSEGELAAQFSVSRPVVREALARIRERGYVETVNGSGTYVRKPSVEAVSQFMARQIRMTGERRHTVDHLYEVRRTIELQTAFLAASRATAEDLDELDRCLRTMRWSAESDPEAYTAADIRFHLRIAEATQNPLFGVLVAPLVDLIVRGMLTSVQVERQGMRDGTSEHERILACVRAGDAEGARAEMASHLANSRLAHPAEVAGVVLPPT